MKPRFSQVMMNHHTNCIFCNCNQLKPLNGFEKSNLVCCKNCNLIFCRNIPSLIELENHYKGYPRTISISTITEKRYDELLDKFERFRKTNNLIDLGCGNALFLKCAKKRGWNVYGTEFDQECILNNTNEGIVTIHPKDVKEKFGGLEFDVVTSFEVMEHINTPNNEMNLIINLLRKSGALYVTTPNFNSISRLLLGENWNIIEYPEHLSYYTPNTLDRVICRYGFSNHIMLTTGFSFSRFRSSKSQMNSGEIPKVSNDENLRDTIEKNLFLFVLKNCINFFLTMFGRGDAMKALYIKL